MLTHSHLKLGCRRRCAQLQRQGIHGCKVSIISSAEIIQVKFFFSSIVVEFAKESRPRRDVYEGERNHG